MISMLFKVISYIFSVVGFVAVLLGLLLYLAIHYSLISNDKVFRFVSNYIIKFDKMCPAEITPASKVEYKSKEDEYSRWLVENLSAEDAARSLLSLNNDEVVKYLKSIDREKSLKIIQEIYSILNQQGEQGQKRKTEINKRILGGLK